MDSGKQHLLSAVDTPPSTPEKLSAASQTMKVAVDVSTQKNVPQAESTVRNTLDIEVKNTRQVTEVPNHLVSSLSSFPDTYPRDSGKLYAGRYELIRMLGEGGMGRVFQAYDPDLKRHVALKFINSSNQEAVQRLLMEGRAQAKISHPNVCRIYEVERVDNQIYIAMQYIDGDTLLDLMGEITLEQKVKVIIAVAEGLHIAHKEGLIHRDVKPHNIMLEKDETGSWKPYIMDFGLAREVSDRGITVTGEILGTPCYMAPEQARGHNNRLDRRTDVYSLGATLYEVLTGFAPFEGESVMDVLIQVLKSDPKPLRQVVPTIPHDLETIVMKCLEKDPAQRYDSAKAFAEDLERFLADEPILGRRASFVYRAKKWVRKNKLLGGFLAGTSLVALILGSWSVYLYLDMKEQARQENYFNSKIRGFENVARYIHMTPLRDTTTDIQLVRQWISDTIKEGENNQPYPHLFHYGLGRAYLINEDYEKAIIELDNAWTLGYRKPEAAYALGLAYSRQYQIGYAAATSQAAISISFQKFNEAEWQQAAVPLRKGALRHLNYCKDHINELVEANSDYIDAIIAFFNKRWDAAIEHADAAEGKAGWFYEALRLKGAVYSEIAKDAMKGPKADVEKAKNNYQKAIESYQEAIRRGPSDQDNYLSLTHAFYEMAIIKEKSNEDFTPEVKNIVENCRKALLTDPEKIDGAYSQLIAIKFLQVRYARRTQQDPGPFYEEILGYLDEIRNKGKNAPKWEQSRNEIEVQQINDLLASGKGIISAQSLVTLNQVIEQNKGAEKKDAKTYCALAKAYLARARQKITQNQDPLNDLQLAQQGCEDAMQLADETTAYQIRGDVQILLAEYQESKGENNITSLERALSDYYQVVKNNPQSLDGSRRLADTYNHLARQRSELHQEATGYFDKALAAYDKVYELDKDEITWLRKKLQIFNYRVASNVAAGEDPQPHILQAQECAEQILKDNPYDGETLLLMAGIRGLQAGYQVLQGLNPRQAAQESVRLAQKSLNALPRNPESYFAQAAAYYALAKQELLSKEPITDDNRNNLADATRRTVRTLQKIIALKVAEHTAYGFQAETYILLIRQGLAEGKLPSEALKSALEAATLSWKQNPDDGEGMLVRAKVGYYRLLAYQKFKTVDSGFQPEQEYKLVETLIEKGLQQNARLADGYVLRAAIRLLPGYNQGKTAPEELRNDLTQALKLDKLINKEEWQLIFAKAGLAD
jgi:eukaryotic-like serine/threonine-protein kinase